MSQPTTTAPLLRLMPREMRMMSERIFSLSSLPRGFALTLTDVPMYSAGLGLGGFALLRDDQEALKAADPTRLKILSEAGAALTLDMAEEPAWIGLNTLIDLAVELVAAHGEAQLTVLNARHPQELTIAKALAGRVGLALTVQQAEGSVTIAAKPAAKTDPLMTGFNADGVECEPDLWWDIYEIARSALAPDTAVSRRHAGVQIIQEDGTVIGRTDSDDDADIKFLARGASEQA